MPADRIHHPFLTRRYQSLLALPLLCLTLVQPISVAAQEIRESLPVLKQKLRHTLFTALLPEKQAQREALFSLEKQLASGGDYKEAIHARDQRLALEQEIAFTQQQLLNPPSTQPSTVDVPENIALENTTAQLNQVTLDPVEHSLTGWTSTDASASWTLPNLPPGGYEIVLRYLLKPTKTPALLNIKESLYHLSLPLEPTDHHPTTKKIGTLRISNGSGPLILQPSDISAEHDLHIHSIALRPCAR